MVKKTRRPLEMSDGKQVRTLEELRECLNVDEIQTHFITGRLEEWLSERYYTDIADEIKKLQTSENISLLKEKICEVLGIQYSSPANAVNTQAVARYNKNIKRLSKFTDDDEILKNAACAVFDQEELAELLDEDEPLIYLCEREYCIPLEKKNMTYIGVGNATVRLSGREEVNFDAQSIRFENVRMFSRQRINVVAESSNNITFSGSVRRSTLRRVIRTGATLTLTHAQATKRLSAGLNHILAIDEYGMVNAWGNDDSRQCSGLPLDMGECIQVSGGGAHSISLDEEGRIYAWGDNKYGQCEAPTFTKFRMVAAGGYHSIALTENGDVFAFGNNRHGECNVPSDLGKCVMVDAGGGSSYALDVNGKIWVWGKSDYGQCSGAPRNNSFVTLSAGYSHAVAIHSLGQIVGWGWNVFKQCNFPKLKNPIAIASGWNHSLALSADGSIFGIGDNSCEQCTTPRFMNVVAIAAGSSFSAAMDSSGRVSVWGTESDRICSTPPIFAPIVTV